MPNTQRSRKPLTATGRAINRILTKYDLTNSDFARALGVSPQQVYNWQHGEGSRLLHLLLKYIDRHGPL